MYIISGKRRWVSMLLEYKIRLIGGEKEEIAEVTCEDRGRLCHIAVCYRDKKIEESASDFFEALCGVRARLEKEGLNLFCYGSSLDVRPSGMGRDMGLGMQAYRMTIGKVAQISDLVGIFDVGPGITPATVAEQKEYFERWRKSERT
ncbi:MAG: hypothetical protein ABSF93_21400 [Candidatus Sulfotelmatobacter sp.]|jgi:hypothetical protein